MNAPDSPIRKLRKLKWKAFYGFLAWRFPTREWVFMNYGYDHPARALALAPQDEGNRYFIQLYAHTLSQAGVAAPHDVLEVGCGRGGGSEWIARTQGVKSMTGLDLSANAVAFCRANHRSPILTFRQGDAESLPFADASFDVVINVESCHHYPSLAAFFREVSRVLRPGGHFCVTSYWEAAQLAHFRRELGAAHLELVGHTDITSYVVNALKASDEGKTALIRRHAPRYLRPMLRFFAAVEGSEIHRGLTDGRLTYVTSLMRKPPAGVRAAGAYPAADLGQAMQGKTTVS